MLAVFAGTSAIGISIGIVGIGGVFLIPLLVWFGLPLETAIGTSLLTFTVTAIAATLVYATGGTVDWRAVLLTSAGSIVSAPLGAKLSTVLPDRVVTACFAFFLLVTGVFALLDLGRFGRRNTPGPALLVVCGVISGVGSGLTGVGGPAILVPLLLLVGTSPAYAVAVSQPNAIFSAASGAAGHVLFGHVDFQLAGFLSIFCALGAVAGAFIHRRMSAGKMRGIIGVAVLVLAVWLIGKLVVAGEGL